jgi:hypothetical protein
MVGHNCYCCEKDIYPGERYEGTVYAHGDGKLVVAKRHIEPECCPEFDDWDEENEVLCDEAMECTKKSASLSRAA